MREHEAHRAALKGGLSVAVGGVNVVGDQAAVAVMVVILNGPMCTPTLVFVSVAILKIGF